MTTSLWVVFGIILAVCGFIFTKTVSNDAKDDYRLRDILANAGNDEETESEEKEEVILPGQEIAKPKFFDEPKPEFKHADEQPVMVKTKEDEKNIYQELAEKQKENYSYSTNTYATMAHETISDKKEKSRVEPETKEESKFEYEKPVYEKINDDACDPCEYEHEEEEDILEDEEKIYAEKDFEDEMEEDTKSYKTVKRNQSLFDYVKMFWKGITFSS